MASKSDTAWKTAARLAALAEEADDDEEKRKEAARKLRLAASKIDRTAMASRKIKGRTVVMATRHAARKAGKRANVRFASASAGRAR